MYEKIVYDGARHYGIGSFPGMEDLTITIDGFSKSYSMTGSRNRQYWSNIGPFGLHSVKG